MIGADYKNQLQQMTHINLQTAARVNMKATRRLVEPVIGQLTERFNIEKVCARKIWYLTNRIIRKVLSHTMGVFINNQLGNPPLQFDLFIGETHEKLRMAFY